MPLLALALVPARGLAQEPTLFSGTWVETAGVDLAAEDPLEDVAQLGSRLDLDLRHPLGDGARVRLGARLWHRAALGHDEGGPAVNGDWPGFGLRYDQWAELREAALQWQTGWGALTVGRDVASWGVLEVQSPLRVVNPTDFSRGVLGAVGGGDDSPLEPRWLVRLERELGVGRLELLYLPFFEQHRFSPLATDAAFVRPGVGPGLPESIAPMLRRLDLRLDRSLQETLTYALEPPPATPLAGSVGGRYRLQAGTWDVGVDVLYDWDRMPALRFDRDIAFLLGKTAEAGFDTAKQIQVFTDPEVQAAQARVQGKSPLDLVAATWHRRLTVGLEAQGELAEGWLLRLEAGFSPDKVLLDEQFEPLRTAVAQAGAGLEWSPGEDLVLLAEALYQHVAKVPAGRTLFLAAPHQVTLAGGAVWKLGEAQAWTLQVAGLYGPTLGDWVALPKVTWEFAEAWKLSGGAVLLGGPPTSPLGLYATDDQAVLELRRSF